MEDRATAEDGERCQGERMEEEDREAGQRLLVGAGIYSP